ncbi:hypothetical protein OG21DRAFT_1495515 [Imleria badia]|nr:hypothetical protein OG21DRAFT_1495515 [Imleria badia]
MLANHLHLESVTQFNGHSRAEFSEQNISRKAPLFSYSHSALRSSLIAFIFLGIAAAAVTPDVAVRNIAVDDGKGPHKGHPSVRSGPDAVDHHHHPARDTAKGHRKGHPSAHDTSEEGKEGHHKGHPSARDTVEGHKKDRHKGHPSARDTLEEGKEGHHKGHPSAHDTAEGDKKGQSNSLDCLAPSTQLAQQSDLGDREKPFDLYAAPA